MPNRRFLALPLLALALAGCNGPSEAEPHEDTFDRGNLSRYTVYNTPTAWAQAEGYLSAGSDAKQSVAIRNGASFADGWVETETSLVSDGGLVLRFQPDGGSYYLMAIRDDTRFGYANLQLYRFQGGAFTELTGQLDINFPRGVSRTFRFEAVGASLNGYVDGQKVIQAFDPTFAAGGFGVRHDNTRAEPGITSRYDLLRWN